MLTFHQDENQDHNSIPIYLCQRNKTIHKYMKKFLCTEIYCNDAKIIIPCLYPSVLILLIVIIFLIMFKFGLFNN